MPPGTGSPPRAAGGQGAGRARVRRPAQGEPPVLLSPTPNFCEEGSLSSWKIPFPWQRTGSLSPAPLLHQFPLGMQADGARPPAQPGRPQPSPGPPEPVPALLSRSSPGEGMLPCSLPLTSWPNGGPRASPRHIGPGSFPRLCPAVSTPLLGLAGPQLSPLSPPGTASTPVPPAAEERHGRE